MDVSIFSPAKLNLFLAVTGRRADGFHDLVSVGAMLDFGDDLAAQLVPAAGGPRFTLACDHSGVPLDGSNLVLRAAAAFAAAADWGGAVHFTLTKRIPVGAGLGGGSSNAVAALRALNRLTGGLLGESKLAEVAATLGSDCNLFLGNGLSVMRGRGERIAPLPPAATARWHGRRLLLFKPGFGVSTPWAYQRMIARGSDYLAPAEAERRVAQWIDGNRPAADLLLNNMQPAVFEKYPALPLLLGRLERAGARVLMSGSGSACFALVDDTPAAGATLQRCQDIIRDCWGADTFLREARVT